MNKAYYLFGATGCALAALLFQVVAWGAVGAITTGGSIVAWSISVVIALWFMVLGKPDPGGRILFYLGLIIGGVSLTLIFAIFKRALGLKSLVFNPIHIGFVLFSVYLVQTKHRTTAVLLSIILGLLLILGGIVGVIFGQ